ncbi:MAG TPA: preprotein translocase subunit YajC [Actinomycetota bacterium]|nr:preprotein translocase subunit YajC [Actinomycetota bacterium]
MLIQLLAQDSAGQGSSLIGLALPVLLIVGFYFLLIRPQRNRQRAQQALLASLEVGDEVMTTGGIFGTIIEMDEDEGVVVVEIAPGTRVRMVRQGIAQRFVEEEDLGEGGDDEGADARP